MQPLQRHLFAEGPEEIFERVHRTEYGNRPLPSIAVVWKRYAGPNARIRLDGRQLQVHLADVLETAPESVHHALAHILFAKLYRRTPSPDALALYREWLYSGHVRQAVQELRRARGKKHLSGPRGQVYDLGSMFDELNQEHFAGALPRPHLGWSRRPSRTLLGHYDPVHHAVVISRILDRPCVPPLAVRYVLFHEMLHLRFPAEHRNGRRCVHTREFREAERRFPGLEEARAALRLL